MFRSNNLCISLPTDFPELSRALYDSNHYVCDTLFRQSFNAWCQTIKQHVHRTLNCFPFGHSMKSSALLN